jgi:hypothetical protein
LQSLSPPSASVTHEEYHKNAHFHPQLATDSAENRVSGERKVSAATWNVGWRRSIVVIAFPDWRPRRYVLKTEPVIHVQKSKSRN